MGVIRTLLGLLFLAAIIVVGYWLYATFSITNPNDRMWVEVNSRLPEPMRQWSCAEVKGRLGGTSVPAGCEGAW